MLTRTFLFPAGWIILSTGFGVRMSALTVATSMVSHQQVARLMTVIVTIETLTDMTVSPTLWKLWSVGLQIGAYGLGLPWFVVASAMLLASVLLLGLRAAVLETELDQSASE